MRVKNLLAIAAAALTLPLLASMPATASTAAKLPQTCHVWRVLYGPYVAEDAYTSRSLAWTTAGAEGSPIYLASYSGHLSQCWKLLGGFGNGEIEFSLANSGMCLRVDNGDTNRGAYMVAWPCLSYSSELFTAIDRSNRVMWKNVKSGLCITADVGITSGSTLDQEGCSNYDASQSWWTNTSP